MQEYIYPKSIWMKQIVSFACSNYQGYRNFEIQIGLLDRWRHRNMRPTIPVVTKTNDLSFSSKSVSKMDYFANTP